MGKYSKEEIEEALKAFSSMISKCEKAYEKLSVGTPQYSLLTKRIKALKMANELLIIEKMIHF